ncbi:MAG: radical SAM protein, partial [Pseudomonadota bacterium]
KGTPDARIPGYRTRTSDGGVLPPVTDLDAIPFPDYTDFPWDRYPNRIIPIMTGRGCGWGKCTFCSDVVTSSGRQFRSRSLGNVIEELKLQSRRHDSKLFTFLDLKLNSNLEVWRGLAEQMQSAVPGAEWTASIHSERDGDDGLSAVDLRNARKAGLIRLTTGLESGSQSVLNAMAKGNSPERLSQTIRYASEAGISVRLTCIVGYPGETDEDVRMTRDFLNQHAPYVDRVVLNRFALQFGTPAETLFIKGNRRMTALDQTEELLDDGLYDFHNATFEPLAHKREMFGVFQCVHNINRQPLNQYSKQFEGVM